MRLRICFSKAGALRYTGHLDLQRIWERTARRAGLQLAYSQGFHPQPKIQVAAALPLGFVGLAELVDLWLDPAGVDPAPEDGEIWRSAVAERLQAAAPPGLGVIRIDEVEEQGPALQTQVIAAEYRVTLRQPPAEDELAGRLEALLASATLPRQRRGKAYDLRPLIEAAALLPPDVDGTAPGARVLALRLSARAGATGRPEEVLEALGIPPEDCLVERVRLVMQASQPAANIEYNS